MDYKKYNDDLFHGYNISSSVGFNKVRVVKWQKKKIVPPIIQR